MKRRLSTAIGSSLCVLTAWLLVGAPHAHGGGFKIQDQSTRAMGMGDAFIAGADDASAVYYNPAGITRLDGPQIISNVYVGHATIYYSGPDVDITSDGRVYVVPSFYVASPLGWAEGVFVGLGVYTPFGLGSKWGDDVVPNLLGQRTLLGEMRLVNVNPTLAYAVNDRLSLGFGVDYFSGDAVLRNSQIYAPGAEGKVEIDANGTGWGYNLGVQFEATPEIVLGLTYRSQVKVGYDGEVEFDNLPTAVPGLFVNLERGLTTSIDFPAVIGAGVSWQAGDKLRLELAAEHTKWETRDQQVYSVDDMGTQVTALDWDNSWVFMLGAEYELNDRWVLRMGYGFNETPAPEHTADATLPTDDMHAVAVGASWRFSDAVSLDLAGLVAYGQEQSLNNTAAPVGDYDAWSTYFSVGVTM